MLLSACAATSYLTQDYISSRMAERFATNYLLHHSKRLPIPMWSGGFRSTQIMPTSMTLLYKPEGHLMKQSEDSMSSPVLDKLLRYGSSCTAKLSRDLTSLPITSFATFPSSTTSL